VHIYHMALKGLRISEYKVTDKHETNDADDWMQSILCLRRFVQ
jgi:hypothetical protein